MPKVSFITPVYNGEKFLRTCIESLLAQTHQDWEYIIVNNCSTDGSLRIAQAYAVKEPRIKVYSNTDFVTADENHNIAFRYVAPDSKYVKVVSADDWITPDCVEKMVALAERHPNVGIVGCLQQRGEQILWKGIPEGVSVVDGRACARGAMLEGIQVLGAPTSVLYRADLVRARRSFYPHDRPHADTDACYEVLTDHDMGFIHEVLAFDRDHPGRLSASTWSLHADSLAYLEAVIKYGPRFLTPEERSRRLAELGAHHHAMLGSSLLKLRGPTYWRFHFRESRAIGFDLRVGSVFAAALRRVAAECQRPQAAIDKAYQYFRARLLPPA